MNVTFPWSRRVCTQPASVTADPASAARSSPSVFVRSIGLVSVVWRVRCIAARGVARGRWLPQRRNDARLDVPADFGDDRRKARLALLFRGEVAHDDIPAARLRSPGNDQDLRAVLYRALPLALERLRGVVDGDREPGAAQTCRELHAARHVIRH